MSFEQRSEWGVASHAKIWREEFYRQNEKRRDPDAGIFLALTETSRKKGSTVKKYKRREWLVMRSGVWDRLQILQLLQTWKAVVITDGGHHKTLNFAPWYFLIRYCSFVQEYVFWCLPYEPPIGLWLLASFSPPYPRQPKGRGARTELEDSYRQRREISPWYKLREHLAGPPKPELVKWKISSGLEVSKQKVDSGREKVWVWFSQKKMG